MHNSGYIVEEDETCEGEAVPFGVNAAVEEVCRQV
jgi:hypothetical protein